MALIELYEYLRWRQGRDYGREHHRHRRRHIYGVRIDTHRPRHLGDPAALTPVATRHGHHRHHHRRTSPVAQLIFDPSGKDTQKLPVTATPVDGTGAAIPGVSFASVSWTVTDLNVATISQDDSGQQFVVPLAPGSVDFTVTAVTADGTSFTDGLHVDIVSAEPPVPPTPTIAGVRIVVGDPVPANDPAPTDPAQVPAA